MGRKGLLGSPKFNKNSVVFIAGIFAVCLISIIAMSWDEIKHFFKKKKTH